MNKTESNKKSGLITRPPIVVVMGHIDHGKSKLLDYVRKSNVVEGEQGGITQHIGAYEVAVHPESNGEESGKKITFLDTPGHEAFSKMRSHGANVADIAILVIASDEGIKTQTMEAHKSIEAAGIPFIIALNKIDKPESNPDKIKSQLAEKGIFVEGLGGKVPTVNISAITGEGVADLLDLILLLAEMEDSKADTSKNAEGIIIESNLEQKRGMSATLIIQDGTLKKGMFISAGGAVAPVRIFEDFHGKSLEEATASSPIKIIGFNKAIPVGVKAQAFSDKKEAEKNAALFTQNKGGKEDDEKQEDRIVLPILIKTDTVGSAEAVEKEIKKLENEHLVLNIIRKSAGDITEDDVKLASSAKETIIIGFNVAMADSVENTVRRFNVKIYTSNIIYKLSEMLEKEISRIVDASITEKKVGEVLVLKKFNKVKGNQVFGGKVIEGQIITDNSYIKIKRKAEGETGEEESEKKEDIEIGEGKIVGLQHNKAPVKEVSEGKEFGAQVNSPHEIMEGDSIEVFRKLS
jgi:translation initiation factor IF-2